MAKAPASDPKRDWRSIVSTLPGGNTFIAIWDWKGRLAAKFLIVTVIVAGSLLYSHFSNHKPSPTNSILGNSNILQSGNNNNVDASTKTFTGVQMNGPNSTNQLNVYQVAAISPVKMFANSNSPLKLNFFAYDGPPLDGTNINGIPWQSNFVEVRLDIENTGGSKLEDVDILIHLDRHITQIAQISSIPNVSFMAVGPTPDVWLTGTNLDTMSEISVPVTPTDQFMSPDWRISCPYLLQHSSIRLLLATVNVNPAVNGRLPDHLFGPRTPPKACAAFGSYVDREQQPPVKYIIRTNLP